MFVKAQIEELQSHPAFQQQAIREFAHGPVAQKMVNVKCM